jgi:hypothetical protein
MNPIEIEQKIMEDLKTIRSPEDLRKLQKWAKHAKKNPIHEPSLESINKYYYWQTNRRYTGAHYYTRDVRTEAIYFEFLGIEILIERDHNEKYEISDNQFNSKKIWNNQMKSYIGTSYYPKEKIDEMFGINFKDKFFQYIKEKGFYLVITKKFLHLTDSKNNAEKLIIGKRLTKFNKYHGYSKFDKQYLSFFDNTGIQTLDYNNIFND